MSGAIGFGIILFGMAAMLAFFGREQILGFEPGDVATFVAYGALGLVLTGWALSHFRGRWAGALQALLVWGVLLGAVSGAYSYRFELQEVAMRIIGSGQFVEAPVVGPNGEVTITRRGDGSFTVPAKFRDKPLRLIFDTGASTVVLTAETARDLGFDPKSLRYYIPVATANGRTMAAPVTLERFTVGSITVKNVSALVTQPGILFENLLGMTFLERLSSYEVRSGRLILRGPAT